MTPTDICLYLKGFYVTTEMLLNDEQSSNVIRRPHKLRTRVPKRILVRLPTNYNVTEWFFLYFYFPGPTETCQSLTPVSYSQVGIFKPTLSDQL